MTANIQTVLGPISPDQLGPTDAHDHLFIRHGSAVRMYPDFLLCEYDLIAHDARLFKAAGGNTIVEMSPIDWGRDIEAMVRLAKDTGLHIVATTGFHKLMYYRDDHWLYRYTEDELAHLICEEIEAGIDVHNYTGPIVARCAAKAGAIKVGTQRGAFNDTERKLLRVAATAQRKTDCPIITHTDEGELALEQIEFLTKEGVPPNRIAISHIDRRLDIGYHKEVASTGAFLEYDALTRVKSGLDASTRRLVLEMIDQGFAKRILVGGDISRQGYWRGYGGGPGLDFVVGDFRASLLGAGAPRKAVEAIYVENARTLLTRHAS